MRISESLKSKTVNRFVSRMVDESKVTPKYIYVVVNGIVEPVKYRSK